MTDYLSKNTKALNVIAGIGSVLAILMFLIFQSLNASIDIPTMHLDGAFQTASGLFRLDMGQAPGRDFFPYLGIGPLVLIYPFFKLAGATLSASVFAAQFVTLVLGWFSVSVLWHLIFRPARSYFSLVGGAVGFFVSFLELGPFSADIYSFAFTPGNSLRPVRAVLPYLATIATYGLIRHCERGMRRNILAGVLIGVALLWSNDFALPTSGMFIMFFCVYFYQRERTTWRSSAVIVIITAVLSWALLLSLISAGHPHKLIEYNFVNVARDQWWFFAPYDPSSRIFDVTQLPKILSSENQTPLLVLLFTILAAARTKKIEHVLLVLMGLTLFAGGCLASIGGHLGGYFGGFYFWGATVTSLAALRGLQWITYKKFGFGPQDGSLISATLSMTVLVSLTILASNKWQLYTENLTVAKNDFGKFYVPEFDGYLRKRWKDYIEYGRKHKNSTITEEYWGLLSSLNKRFSPWPVDAVIHALGGVRGVAKLSLADTDLIVSTRYRVSPQWQPWNLSQNFWFYEELLTSREPDFSSPTTIVWRKITSPREQLDVGCAVSKTADSVIIQSKAEGFYAVTLNYTSTGTGRHLLMLRNNISFAGDARGFVSLPPGGPTATIPALVTLDSGNIFDSKVVGSENVRILITSCKATRIAYKNEEILNAEPRTKPKV